MSKLRTHYDNLQVKETASDEVIKGAYKYLSQKWHPDRHENKEEAERVTKIINRAYAVLSDPVQRKAHDEWIRAQQAPPEPPPQEPPPEYSYRTEPPHQPESSSMRPRRPNPSTHRGRWNEFRDWWASLDPPERPSLADSSATTWEIVLLRVWTYVILPLPPLLLMVLIIMDLPADASGLWGLIGALNWQQVMFLGFFWFLINGLHDRQAFAWGLNWIPIVVVAALPLHFGLVGGALGGLWLWWSSSTWLRLRRLFVSGGEREHESPRQTYKPFKNKIWSGWKSFLISYLAFVSVSVALGEEVFGAIIFSFFGAAAVGLVFAVISDLELSR